MKIIKIISLTFLSFFIFGVMSVSATDVTGSVSITVAIDGTWSDYGACNVNTCGKTGTQTRTCTPPQNGGKACSDIDGGSATKSCSTPACPVDGVWSSYGACSLTCGGGTQTRTCTPAQNGGKACSDIDGGSATKSCNNQACACSAPLTKDVTADCDKNVNGDASISGSVIRKQTKSDFPGCAFPATVTNGNSTYVSDSCVYPPSACSAPLTKDVTADCDKNVNGDAAISGSVTRKQTKSAFPGCAFPATVTNGNSTYVSDSCVYPISTCSEPLTKNVTVDCDLNALGQSAISGSVKRSQSKSAAPSCSFPSSITTANSTYVSDSCVYPAIIPPTPPVAINGVWSDWSPLRSNQCGATGTQTRGCNNPAPKNGGSFCPSDADGVSLTKDYVNLPCPTVDIQVKRNNKVIISSEKVPYNSRIDVSWTSKNAVSCSCSSLDVKGVSGSCGSGINSSYKTGSLTKEIKFTVSCEGGSGMMISDSASVLVDKINPNYIEQI